MTSEEEAAIMVTGKPLARRPPVELEQDPEVLEANQVLYRYLYEARVPTINPTLPKQDGQLQKVLDRRLAEMLGGK